MAKLMVVSETDPGIAVIVSRNLMIWRGECTECGPTPEFKWIEEADVVLARAQEHIDKVHG